MIEVSYFGFCIQTDKLNGSNIFMVLKDWDPISNVCVCCPPDSPHT